VSRIHLSIDRRTNASSRRQIERREADTISPAEKIVSAADFDGEAAMQDVFTRDRKVFPRHDFGGEEVAQKNVVEPQRSQRAQRKIQRGNKTTLLFFALFSVPSVYSVVHFFLLSRL
jgi:hypothetical protein